MGIPHYFLYSTSISLVLALIFGIVSRICLFNINTPILDYCWLVSQMYSKYGSDNVEFKQRMQRLTYISKETFGFFFSFLDLSFNFYTVYRGVNILTSSLFLRTNYFLFCFFFYKIFRAFCIFFFTFYFD